ncbi:MAG TPA: bifunctional diaminohydroxyphosphoribosylaminopyrimidine deaminase/5-amino-6-(5-phosphoribosylamino)uracil reductase RibD [Gammaproteobacteria bacterium]|nr:bifunctional diaminohydroxyphosphoribosylaminopyrimidine deaminase/5-amino-6-(5-phosphoribosylamino)uracil reductase RibD [Gammaproteobacteria bacterium]
MARALRLAERGLLTTAPNPRVGCVLVRDDTVVGEGWHEFTGGPHAEINALQQAGPQAAGATAYVTLEPCCHQGRTPPCTDALIAAGVARVVAAIEDPNPRVAGMGLAALRNAGIDTAAGLLAVAAEQLNAGFVMRMRQGRPWVRCKLAMSLDGRTAMASGESRWITGDAARRDVHRLRARSAAIMTGIGTVQADDPSLTVRLDALDDGFRQPLRVILDSQLRTPPDAKLLDLPGDTLIVSGADDAGKAARLTRSNVSVVTLPMQVGRLDLPAVLHYLGTLQINEVHLEAGATLCGALLQAGLIDELVIYMAPHLMGDAARGLFALPGLEQMAQRIKLAINDIRAVGDDWRITAGVEN